MTFPEHTQAEFQQLIKNEENLIEAAAKMEDKEFRRCLLEVLVLMAICDGELGREEKVFLREISGRLGVPLDLDDAKKRTRDYRTAVRQSMVGRATRGSARNTVTVAESKARSILDKVFIRGSVYENDLPEHLQEPEHG
jgi:hypothetical protein